MKLIKYKFFGFIIGSLAVYVILYYSLFDTLTTTHSETFINLKYVVVHLDLKGAPLKLSYLKSLLPFFKKFGVNGILMEYEDMFPYQGSLVNLSSRNCYDKTELQHFLKEAVESHIEIIPLVQTFGHMEHVLKLEEFQHLREHHLYPDSICPSNPQSIQLLKDMLSQMINFHSNVTPLKHIHIGCDEVYHMNKCQRCLLKNKKKIDIFINHLLVLKQIISGFSSHTTVLIWDDMFRSIKKKSHIKSNMGIGDIEPVYWDYTPDLSVSHLNLFNYHKTFENMWIASAFKGADGRQAILPNLRDRCLNHFMWMNLILDYVFAGERKVFNFKGIILTGWSRYSHMDPLCELFPASIPSLVINLLMVQKFRFGISIRDTLKSPFDFLNKYLLGEFSRDLRCNKAMDVDNLFILLDTCGFESVALYGLMKQYKNLASDIDAAFSKDGIDLSAVGYNSKMKNINLNNVNRSIEWCNFTLKDLTDWEINIRRAMSEYYTNFVIEEFVGQRTLSAKTRVRNTLNMLERYMDTRVWGRRPYVVKNAEISQEL